jgi:ADP-ribose pyrophosphatase YjhB (NUDIX family)
MNEKSNRLDPDFRRESPPGDTVERDVCHHCGFVSYDNPKIVVGSVVRSDNLILLCRRAIAPRIGYWTLPAGYMELNETPADGARREALEEANATIDIQHLLAVYSIPRISQVQLIYRARLEGAFSAGPESQEVDLFEWDRIPWGQLAFPSVHWALQHDAQAATSTPILPFGNPAGQTGDRMPSPHGL